MEPDRIRGSCRGAGWRDGGKQPTCGIKDLYDSGLVRLRESLQLESASIQPQALADRKRLSAQPSRGCVAYSAKSVYSSKRVSVAP